MKRVLAVIMAAILLAVLMVGCSKEKPANKTQEDKAQTTPAQEPEPTQEPTQEPTPTENPEPEAAMLAPETVFNCSSQFDIESATGENVPWIYSFTTDGGKTFDPCTIMEATGGLKPWHPWGGNWTGVGLNADVPGRVELNTDMLGGITGVLGFKAPTDGAYAIVGDVSNPWGQNADVLHCSLNGTDLFTVQPGGADVEPIEFPYTEVELKAGDIVYFYCPSTAEGDEGWVSAYIDINITYEP